MAKVLTENPDGAGRRVGVAVARFNEVVTERLLDGALETLRAQGVADDDVTVAWVPGAFELPSACRWLAQAGCDALVMLGAIACSISEHVSTPKPTGTSRSSWTRMAPSVTPEQT
jgi:6,7-dimethyl-8-ribityllumazine synthase